MSKKHKRSEKISNEKIELIVELKNVEDKNENKTIFDKIFSQKFVPYLIISLFSILLYANTFNHQFALDDDIVICKNDYVLNGIGGFEGVFSKDLYESFYRQMNTKAQLTGGRYRPLSVATFALEQELIGTRNDANFEQNCWDLNKNNIAEANEDINKDGLYNDKDCRAKGFGLRHIVNVLFYAGLCCVIFMFLSNIVFKENKLLSLLITLLYVSHPIHTEVVANVKSRDEIMSLMFMLGTIYLAHLYERKKDFKYLILFGISFMAALLSKEYGATLLLLVPLSLFLFEFKTVDIKKYFPLGVVLAIVFGIYYAIRSSIVIGKSNYQDTELLNNPYLLANENQQLATKLFIFLKYIFTLIFPHPLSSDYSYNSIPYRELSDPLVWISVLSLFGFVFGIIYFLKKKSWVAFALAFYLFNILLVTNLIFNVGATMGERLAFHSSLAFCMFLGYAIFYFSKKMKNINLMLLLSIPILLLYSFKTIDRNKAWENDVTLALTDVKTQPESVSLNGNASSRSSDMADYPVNKGKEKQYLEDAIKYGRKAVGMHPKFVNGMLNLGIAFAKLQQYDSTEYYWKRAFDLYPSLPSKPLYYSSLASSLHQKGREYGQKKEWQQGLVYLEKAVQFDSTNAGIWYDLGGFSFSIQNYNRAKQAWDKAYQLNPTDSLIKATRGFFK
ncbi:MAG: glycosyltransferase family 39 protein [Chitinophagaceae bacterium]|nr:glycosyltransferase family 39 protein [Chitinophagaceae bacterium]